MVAKYIVMYLKCGKLSLIETEKSPRELKNHIPSSNTVTKGIYIYLFYILNFKEQDPSLKTS